MSRSAYILCFTIFAFIFIPVIFPLGAVSMIGPCSYAGFAILQRIAIAFHSDPVMSNVDSVITYLITFYFGILLILYCGIFYLCGRFTFRISQESPEPSGRLFFQIIFLFIVFFCSYLKVIHSDSFVNSTGTYNFWTGATRFAATF